MQKMGSGASYEDLGGPTPENYKTDDNSAKLNTPGSTLKQVKDVANSKAGKADPAPKGMKEEEVEVEGEVVAEDEVTETEATIEETVEETVKRKQPKPKVKLLPSKKKLLSTIWSKTYLLCSLAKNSLRNSKRKHVPFLKLLSKQKLLKSKKN